MLSSFVAIDVETANFEPSSICAIGAVKVENGLIVDERYSLVCPEPNYYKYRCISVHGITDDDTWNAPTFGEVWESLWPWIDGRVCIAHNAAFDSRCIGAACNVYGLEEPAIWQCTLREARRKIPREMLASKSLDSLCDFFGITLEHHHNALDDARACAKLATILIDV